MPVLTIDSVGGGQVQVHVSGHWEVNTNAGRTRGGTLSGNFVGTVRPDNSTILQAPGGARYDR
jgi:hypothetical protein